MGRTLSSRNQTEVAKTGTIPIYLFELGFDVPLRLCTYDDVSWNGYTWARAPIALAKLQGTEGGGQTGEIRLGNLDNVYSALILNEGARGRTCKIWQLYGEPTYAVGDGVPLFDGYMDEVPDIDDEVRITIASEAVGTRRTPQITLHPWFGDDLTPPGTVIVWGGDTYILESRDG